MKRIKKIAVLLLAVVMLCPIFASCASFGTPVMQLGDTEITANMVEFWISRYKAYFEYYYGSAVCQQYGINKLDQFWPIVADPETGKTFDDVMSASIYENARTYLGALYLFDQFGLALPEATLKDIEKRISEFRETYASGSKSEFNALLSNYGINDGLLRELYIIDEKIAYLQEYLYGADGILGVTNIDKENYYQKNYVRMRQICIFINERPVTNEQGEFLTDENGNTRYEDMTATQTQEARARADEALKKLKAGESFQSVSKIYDENTADDSYVNGLYMSSDSALGTDATLERIFKELQTMEVGEIKMIEAENTLHIIEKRELDEGAYDKESNSDFFKFYDPETQNYVTLEGYLREPLFLEYVADCLEKHSADIKINEEELNKKKFSNTRANPYY